MSVWDKRKQISDGNELVKQDNPTPEYKGNGTECYGG